MDVSGHGGAPRHSKPFLFLNQQGSCSCYDRKQCSQALLKINQIMYYTFKANEASQQGKLILLQETLVKETQKKINGSVNSYKLPLCWRNTGRTKRESKGKSRYAS